MTGIDLIGKERARQVEEECWTAEHDDGHTAGQLAAMAACYAMGQDLCKLDDGTPGPRDVWPWTDTAEDTFLQRGYSKDRVRQLAIAGALIAAEIDRLLRRGRRTEQCPTT